MNEVIRNIIEGYNCDEIAQSVKNSVFMNGPIFQSDMEILSLLSLYRAEVFSTIEEDILLYMGVFYKPTKGQSLDGILFEQYRNYLTEKLKTSLTPVQYKISTSVVKNKCYSFSAPTSTGKSFVFMKLIEESKGDIVIVVPSRALINEYYLKITSKITDKKVNILTFIDRINTKRSTRSIFIVTPERCRELFKKKELFDIQIFMFDEAQLGNEDSKRGLYFDSIIRRCEKSFPIAKFIFAHPFVINPEAQIIKNNFPSESSSSECFTQKNVGQIYMCRDDDWQYYHFGIDKKVMGSQKQRCQFDPISKIMSEGGSVLFYVSKSKIYSNKFATEFARYIDECDEIESDVVDNYVEQIRNITGGSTKVDNNYFSKMLSLLKRGIVIHHGSLPLQTRILIEQFTQAGFCRLCFATSTLEQGINMPFDAVYIDRLESSKPLSVKNLIGRAGRSTSNKVFDYGYVILSSTTQMSNFRKIMASDERLDEVSALERPDENDDDYNDFKKSIINGDFSDEYNLTNKEIINLSSAQSSMIVSEILDSTFVDGKLIQLEAINRDLYERLEFYRKFKDLYEVYLGRKLESGEENVLVSAIKIMLWRVYGRSFKNICWYRYSYVSRADERERMNRNGIPSDNLEAKFMTGYHDIPDKGLNVFSLFNPMTKAHSVDYDLVMYDTYDFIDKLIGFKLSDIFYAAFKKHYETTKDIRALALSNFIKYGTNDEREVWMLRYGLSFEDIEKLGDYIISIDESEIRFKESVKLLSYEDKISVIRFID